MFLVLPAAFFNGTAAIVYPLPHCILDCLTNSAPQKPVDMALFWIALAFICLILGFLVLKLYPKPGSGIQMGLAFSLGSMALLSGTVLLDIFETFVTTPASYLVFPGLAVTAMAGATVLYSYGFARGKLSGRVNSDKQPTIA